MVVTYSSETTFESHKTAQSCIPDGTLHSHHYENIMFLMEFCHLYAFSGNVQETCDDRSRNVQIIAVLITWPLVLCSDDGVPVSACLVWCNCKCSATENCVATMNINSYFHLYRLYHLLMMWVHNLGNLPNISFVQQRFTPYNVHVIFSAVCKCPWTSNYTQTALSMRFEVLTTPGTKNSQCNVVLLEKFWSDIFITCTYW